MRKQKQSQGAFKGEEYQSYLAGQKANGGGRRQLNENQMSVAELKERLKEKDVEFKRLEKVEVRRNDDVLDSELNKLKEERQQVRLKKKEDENVLHDLLYELE